MFILYIRKYSYLIIHFLLNANFDINIFFITDIQMGNIHTVILAFRTNCAFRKPNKPLPTTTDPRKTYFDDVDDIDFEEDTWDKGGRIKAGKIKAGKIKAQYQWEEFNTITLRSEQKKHVN